MPRGYLKHNKSISRKEARGGSSYRRPNESRKAPDTRRDKSAGDDFSVSAPRTPADVRQECEPNTYHVAECAICLEEKPVLCISKTCKWHDAACSKCLRRVYVTDAQKSVKNYPLRCFHPLCDQPIQASQLEKHNFFASFDEIRKHHEMLVMYKIQNTEGMRTVHCPKCSSPRGISKLDKDCTYGCKNCKAIYQVTPDYATIRALENMQCDEIGVNDGWAKCPSCGVIISKGDGCDHMECSYCFLDFSWEEAQARRPPLARPPDSEIYLWW